MNDIVSYNPEFLEKIDIFSKSELKELVEINHIFSLKKFQTNKNLMSKFGFYLIYNSAKNVANSYTEEEARNLLFEGMTVEKKFADAMILINLKKAHKKLLEPTFKFSKESFEHIYQILSNSIASKEKKHTPRNHKTSINIGGHVYMPLEKPNELDIQLEILFRNYHFIKNPFNRAVYLHSNLIYLQYFSDFNKIIAQLMLNMSLKNDGKIILVPDEKNDNDYKSSLLPYYEEGDYTKFKEYFISNYKEMTSLDFE